MRVQTSFSLLCMYDAFWCRQYIKHVGLSINNQNRASALLIVDRDSPSTARFSHSTSFTSFPRISIDILSAWGWPNLSGQKLPCGAPT